MRKQKQLYLEGKRQRAIGYDFSPLMGDPFEGFGDEGVLVGKTMGIYNPEKIPTADQTNETVLTKAQIRNAPVRLIKRQSFAHPMLQIQNHSPMGVDIVNHVMEKNGPVALEIKDLSKKMRAARFDDATLTSLATDYLSGKSIPFIREREGGKLFLDIFGDPIVGLPEKIAAIQAQRSYDFDYSNLKAALAGKIDATSIYDVSVYQSLRYLPGARARADYLQGIVNTIIAQNKTAQDKQQASDYFKAHNFTYKTPDSEIVATIDGDANFSFTKRFNPTFYNNFVNNVIAYKAEVKTNEYDKQIQTWLTQGYKSVSEIPPTSGIFGPIQWETMVPGITAAFNTAYNAKKTKELDDAVKKAINRDIWTAEDFYKDQGGFAAINATSQTPQAIAARQEVQNRMDWYRDNSKEGTIKKYRDRMQYLIANTEEGRAIAAEDARIQRERDAEGGFFSTLLKIIGPLAAIVLPFAAPALLTSLPVVGSVSSAVTTAVSALPIVSKVADVVTTVKAAVPTEVIDNAKTMYNAGTSVINTVYPAKPPTTSSVLPVAPVAPAQPVKAPEPVVVAAPVKKPVKYYEHPMLTYGLIKRKA